MPISYIGTAITFNDSTSQTTAAPAFSTIPVVRIYESPATWSKPSNLKGLKVISVGGGGSGENATPGVAHGGAGGGAGGSAIKWLQAPAIPSSVSISVGSGGVGSSGGTTSFGPFCSGTGGAPGVTGGLGGTGSGGDVNIAGGDGNGGTNGPATNTGMGGPGGSSLLGQGGVSPSGGTAPGTGPTDGRGKKYGGGGGGGNFLFNTNYGQGHPGVVIVEEFY